MRAALFFYLGVTIAAVLILAPYLLALRDAAQSIPS